MTSFLIDNLGETWPASSAKLSEQMGFDRWSESERSRFLVTNLGFVSLRRGRRGLWIELRPTFLRRETFAALLLTLRDMPESRVVVSTLQETWTERLWGSVDEAREAIVREFETAICERGGYFAARQTHLLCLENDSPLRRAYETAAARDFSFDAYGVWAMLENSGVNRYALLRAHSDPEQIHIVAHGEGYSTFSPKWNRSASGRKFFDLPDRAYARSAAKGFSLVSQDKVPRAEDVSASLWWAARGRYEIKYKRLLLPITIADKGEFLLTVSDLKGVS